MTPQQGDFMSIIKLIPQSEQITIEGYLIKAIDIHPSILKGLIPVEKPCFLGVDGEVAHCRTLVVDFDGDIQDVNEKKLQITYMSTKRALESGFIYLYTISLVEGLVNTHPGIKIVVRGA